MQIGERIAAYRKRRGMSQDALAGLVGMSRSWLSQVERGIHTVDRLSTLVDLAAVLRVDVADLVGREWRLAPNGGSHVQAIDAVGDNSPTIHICSVNNVSHGHSRSSETLRSRSIAPTRLRIMTVLQPHFQSSRRRRRLRWLCGRAGREIYLARCMVYAVTAKLLTKVGEGHMAWLAADRATHAAIAADSLNAQGVAAYQAVVRYWKMSR